jgi:hypothetical protein
MKIDTKLFSMPNFESCINNISFQNTEITDGRINNSIPTLIIRLESGLELKLARYISYTDYDPYHYTRIKDKDIDIIDSEWSENFDNGGDIKWKEDTSKEGSLEDFVGKKIRNIEHYTWNTLIYFEENLFINLTNDKSTRTYTLSIGIWAEEIGSAEKLGHIELD